MIRKNTRDVQEIWRGVSMQRHGKYCMHKEHRDYKNVEQRRDEGCVSDIICLGLKNTQVCKLHGKRPNATQENLFSDHKSSERVKF
jgi:hypothetical protein